MAAANLHGRCGKVRGELAKGDLTKQGVISGKDIESLIAHYPAESRDRIFTPDVTLFALLNQAITPGASCSDAIASVRADRVAAGLAPCSTSTASYVRARQRLPLKGLQELARLKANQLEQLSPKNWLWKNRHIKVLDGTTFSAADTPENQAAFPQHTNQKPGLGFPLIRMAILTSLATGAALACEIGPFSGECAGEIGLAAKLLTTLEPKDILVADRYYLSYFFISLVSRVGADFVTRHFDHRKFNVVARRRVNAHEEIITLKKPRIPHTGWLEQRLYDAIPDTLTLRRSKIKIIRNGFRDEILTTVTTLLDPSSCTVEDLGNIYLWRWQVELDLRQIKGIMGLNVVLAKSPEMIEKELWSRLLAYNIIRTIVAKAASNSAKAPRQLGFKFCISLVKSYQRHWSGNSAANAELLSDLLIAITTTSASHRPGRHEPRCVKRRKDQTATLLRVPRKQWKEERAA